MSCPEQLSAGSPITAGLIRAIRYTPASATSPFKTRSHIRGFSPRAVTTSTSRPNRLRRSINTPMSSGNLPGAMSIKKLISLCSSASQRATEPNIRPLCTSRRKSARSASSISSTRVVGCRLIRLAGSLCKRSITDVDPPTRSPLNHHLIGPRGRWSLALVRATTSRRAELFIYPPLREFVPRNGSRIPDR